MWILPKQLHTSAFVPDTEALISDLAEQSQICGQSLFLRSKPSPARTWSQKWKRDSWTQHLSGRILKPSLGESFVESWTSSLGATRANHSAQQESVSELKIQDTSGPTLQMELLQCDQVSVSLKTSRDISRWGCPTSLKTWDAWVTEVRGAYSLRLKSAHLTRGSGSSSWPTVRTNDSNSGRPNDGHSRIGVNGQRFGINLSDKVEHLEKNWPTVTATEARQGFQDRSRGMKGQQESLTTIVVKESGLADQDNPNTHGSRQESWLTPNTMDSLPVRSEEALMRQHQTNRKGRTTHSTLREQVVLPSPKELNWSTPRAGATDNSRPNNKGGMPLADQAKREVWRTPCSSDGEGGIMEMRPGTAGKYKLRDHVHAKWATPSAYDWNQPETKEQWEKRAATQREKGVNLHLPLKSQVTPETLSAKLNPRWVETLMGLPVGWVMPSCIHPITPIAEPVMSIGEGNWMTPEAQNSTGYQVSNGKKILRLGSQVTSTPPVTIELTNSDCSATELCQQPQNSHGELFVQNLTKPISE